MTAVRDRIRGHVAEHPGVHFRALARDLDLASGQVQYHLRVLRDEAAVVAEEYYGRTHYYPPDCDDWERGALAVTRRETARDVLLSLLDADAPSTPAEVAADVGVARSTLEHHVDHLVSEDVVEKRRDQRNRVTLEVRRPEATARVLRAVAPSAPERFVDRLERLLDAFLG